MGSINDNIVDRRNTILKQFKKSLTKYGIYYLFLLPFLIPFILFLIYPLLNAFIYSFHKFNLTTYKFVGLKNYIDIFSEPLFRKSIITTCWFAIGAVPSILFITILLSAILIKLNDKMRTVFVGIFYLPAVTSVITFILTWKWIYNYRYGILNSLVRLLGYENINWLSNKYTALPAIVAMVVYSSLGMPIILFVSAMAGIPQTLYEAARIDGASEWQTLWHITVPLIRPTTLYLLIILTINIFQIFTLILLMTGGGPYYRTTTMSFLMIQEAFQNSNFGVSSTIGIIFLGIIGGLALVQYKYFSKDVEY